MKKCIALVVFGLTLFFSVNAQSQESKLPEKEKTNYSFLWGLFQSDGYKKSKQKSVEVEMATIGEATALPPVDSSKYEVKSILWGMVQWTEKKKDSSNTKTDDHAE